MRLLVFNLATDDEDPILGFATEWIRALAVHCEALHVVTMRRGRAVLPTNVSVFSVGKERGFSEFRRGLRFYRHLGRLLLTRSFDGCFAHMMPLFAVMGAPLLRLRGVRTILWYAHRAVTPTLKAAACVVERIITSSPDGCRLRNSKVRVTGQGIDTALFVAPQVETRWPAAELRLVHVGRIAPVKRLEILISAARQLRTCTGNVRLDLVGPVGDERYARMLRDTVERDGLGHVVHFTGPLERERLPDIYGRAHFMLNASATGSIDKAVLEGMLCGALPVTCNVAFAEYLSRLDPLLYVARGSGMDLAAHVAALWRRESETQRGLAKRCRESVLAFHSLDSLTRRIMDMFESVGQRSSPPRHP